MTSFPPALPHSDFREIFPDVFFVTGSIAMPGPVPVRFSRNMVVVRQGERLVLVNSMRLTDAGLRALDALGRVTDVLRLAGFHGADDAFYKDHYGAKVSAIAGQRYQRGFDGKGADYFTADAALAASSELPIEGAKLFVFESRPPEALLLLPAEGGILVSGDSLQNWATTDDHFNWLAKRMMKWMGFIKPHNVGPAWVKQAKPVKADWPRVLELPFEHLLPAHGAPVIGGAKAAYRPAIERAMAHPQR
jgi:hypothetical protein